jgi:hypothetical protein
MRRRGMAETVRGIPENEGKGASSKAWIIIVVLVVVLCCLVVLCGGAAWWLWENGDTLLEDLTDWSAIFSLI